MTQGGPDRCGGRMCREGGNDYVREGGGHVFGLNACRERGRMSKMHCIFIVDSKTHLEFRRRVRKI